MALLKTGSAFVSPALSAIADGRGVSAATRSACSPAPACSRASTACTGLYVGVPCVIGAGGVERVLEVEMDAEERKLFDASVEHVRALVDQIQL